MTVIADLTLPPEAFALGRALDGLPALEVELESIVPLQGAVVPLFWVAGTEPHRVERRLATAPETETVQRLTTAEDRTLFEVHWSQNVNGLVDALEQSRARILEATGTAEGWDVRLRVPEHEALSTFNRSLTEERIPVTLRHIYNPTPPEEGEGLSTNQRRTLLAAYHAGYFEVPRETSLAELAEREGVSDSALSQRLRRSLQAHLEATLVADERPRP